MKDESIKMPCWGARAINPPATSMDSSAILAAGGAADAVSVEPRLAPCKGKCVNTIVSRSGAVRNRQDFIKSRSPWPANYLLQQLTPVVHPFSKRQDWGPPLGSSPGASSVVVLVPRPLLTCTERKSPMKLVIHALGLLSLVAPVAVAQTSTWAIDPAHSEVDFAVRHMGVSNIHGRIGGINGTIALNEADATKSTVSVTI